MVDLQTVIKQGKKKRGEGTYLSSKDLPYDFHRIPTGIFSIDYSVGGGFPVGVTSSIYGPPGGSKTTCLFKLIAQAQKICWKCFNYAWDCTCESEPKLQDAALISTECHDMEWAVKLGVDPERVVLCEPDHGEQASDIIAECLKAQDCGIVALDSLAMLTPIAEIESSAEEVQVASQAKLISKMMRRIKSILIREKKKGHPVMFIAINQVRAKIGGYGMSEETPGGFVSKHDWHLMFRLSQLSSKKRDSNDIIVDSKFSMSMKAMGTKHKLLTLAGAAEFLMSTSDEGAYPVGTINDFNTVYNYGLESGLITKTPWSCCEIPYKTKADMFDDWLNDKVFLSTKKQIVQYFIDLKKNKEKKTEKKEAVN